MPGKNNTSSYGSGPVGDGTFGTDSEITSAIGRSAQDVVSLTNIEYQLGTNKSVQNYYSSLISMVSNWPIEEEMRQIENYGNVYLLNKGENDKSKVDDVLVRTLLQKMPKDELKKFVNQVVSEQQELIKDIRKTNTLVQNRAKKYFNISSLKTQYNKTAQYAADDRQLSKGIEQNYGIELDNALKKDVFPKLRKELTDVLHGYTKIDLAASAERLDIEFEDNISIKQIITKICNIVNIYVSIVLGESKGVAHMSLSPDCVEEIEKLLQMTSYTWVTGKVAISAKELSNKKNSAYKAKRIIDASYENAKAKDRIVIKTNKFFNKGTYKNVKTKSGFKSDVSGAQRELVNNLRLFDDLSDAQLKNLILAYIPDIEQVTVETMKRSDMINVLSRMAGSEISSISKQESNLSGIKNNSKRIAATNAVNERKKNSLFAAINKENSLSQDFSDEVPTVTFNQAGDITSETINTAVPVFVVGSIDRPGALQSKAQAAENKNKDLNKFESAAWMKYAKLAEKGLSLDTKSSVDLLGLRNSVNSLRTGLTKNKFTQVLQGTLNNANYPSNSLLTNNSTPSIIYNTPNITSNNKKTLTKEQLEKMLAGRKNKAKPVKGTFSALKRNLSTFAVKEYGGRPFDDIVTPVLEVSNTHDLISSLENKITSMKKVQADIAGNISQLPTLFGSLQSAGTSVNAASAGAGLAATITNAISMYNHMATGGTMTAKNSISNIVTGDHPKGKNNTELVSVDWNNKKINVKPIPKMATGGSVSKSISESASNVKDTNRMSLSERNKPLTVGIGTGLISYSKVLSDVSDDGTSTAIKVYSINTGITDKIKIGDSSVSLFDAVYGIYSSLPSIVSGISQGNQLLASIASNTASTNSKLNSLNSTSSATGFSFPTNLDSILQGK